MSRYVHPASNAAWKIGGLNRGSHALRIASTPSARASSLIAAASDASSFAAAKRGSSRPATTCSARPRSTSPSTIRSTKGRVRATAAAAPPTPPAPTTRTFTLGDPPRARILRGHAEVARYLNLARDGVENAGDVRAGRLQRGDRDQRDQRDDERVLDQCLAALGTDG